jgi:hypothetical protein
LFRIVSGSKAAKSLDGIGEIGGALDPFLQAQLEEAIEQTLIDRIVLILALGAHAGSVAHDEREGEPAVYVIAPFSIAESAQADPSTGSGHALRPL